MRFAAWIATFLLLACLRAYEDPLVSAVRSGDVKAAKALLASGEDPNRPFGVNDWPPLMHAVHKNQIKTATVLLTYGADVDCGGPDGMTPLMMAAAYGNADMVRLLLKHHADLHLKTSEGSTALDYALTGLSDIDNFTMFSCMDETAKLLRGSEAQLESRLFARLKRCRQGT